MSYLYCIAATIMFSLVGTLVKAASVMAPASAVTFSRFFFGVITLLLICLCMRHRPKIRYGEKWIWFAVIGKCVNYFAENTALQRGASFGNIVTFPVQAIVLCFYSALIFKEKIGPRKIISTILCISGVLIISWNGHSLSEFLGQGLPLTLLFMLSALGAGTFVLSQKMLLNFGTPEDVNLSVFIMGALISAVPCGFAAKDMGAFRIDALAALIGLGVITGAGFLLNAKSLKKMSLVVNGMIQNSSSIFALFWAAIFWHEPITFYVILGTFVFLIGLVFINVAPKKGIFVN